MEQTLASLTQSIERLSPRERRLLIVGAVVVALIVVVGMVLPLQRRVSTAAQRIERKRDDLVWLRSVAPQLSSLAVSRAQPLRESLVVLIDRTARDSGLGKSLVGSQPSGTGALSVHFEQVPFDGLVSWLTQLGDHYAIHAESATIDAGSGPGIVNATLLLRVR